MQEKIPEFRFDGFTDTWEQRKLGEIAEIVRGASPRPIKDPKWFDTESDIGWLRISDVTEQNGRIYYLEQRISKLGQKKTRVLLTPHLLLSIAATVGKPLINYVKTGVHDGFLVFMKPKFDLEYMFQWLDAFRLNWQRYGQPGSQVNLNSDLVKNQELLLPSISEQQSIGAFFSTFDHLITLQQRELDYLKETKKTMLSELFPKKSETIPGVRFGGFTDAWEQRKLGDVLSIPEPEKLQIPTPDSLMTVGLNLAGLRKGGNRETLSLGATNYFIRRSGQLIYGKQNFFNGSIALVTSEFDGMATSNDVPALNIDGDEVHRLFLYVFLARPSYYQSKEAYASGTGSKRIHEHTLFEFDISLPSLYEQKQVSSFFSTLDHLITLQQRKLDLLKSQKQTLLKSMFPR